MREPSLAQNICRCNIVTNVPRLGSQVAVHLHCEGVSHLFGRTVHNNIYASFFQGWMLTQIIYDDILYMVRQS